jgi:OOP family OmpA-OmpF porin
MRLHLRLGRWGLMAIVMVVGLVAPRRSSADVITIDDGAVPSTTSIPFTCALGTDNQIWLPYMGFVYRRVEPFELSPGDTIAFDIQMRTIDPDDLGFAPQLDIALAYAPDPANPFKPSDLPGATDFTIVAHSAIAASKGNRAVEDYDLAYTVDTPFKFPGGGLIIRVGNPKDPLASKTDVDCLPVITADQQPNGTNRLVGTFKLEDPEYPWVQENTMFSPYVPYVQIKWTRCGDGRVSGNEVCDDGNNDNTDDCTNSCLAPACGDGFVQPAFGEECDSSDDPFCDNDTCKMQAFAKGSGCEVGGGGGLWAGLVGAAVVLVLVRRRRGAAAGVLLIAISWAAPARAQAMKTEGFRVDRFELAPSVDDAIIVQDPAVLGHMVWSVNAALGFSNTLLRVVPRLDSDTGIDVVGPRLSAYLDFAIGFLNRFEVNASLPFALAQSTDSGVAAGYMLKEPGSTAVGDGRVGGSVLLYGKRTGPQFGLAAALFVPLGSENSFTGDGGFAEELVGTAGFVRPGYRILVNAGLRFRPNADYVTTDQGTEYIGRAGVVVPFINNRLNASLELDVLGRTADKDPNRELASPVLALLGARYHFAGGIRAGAGVGMGLTEAPGSPAIRTLVTVGYSPEPKKLSRSMPPPEAPLDSDGDGIADNLDKCPKDPEDFDGVDDGDGCPDPDADQDKIVDTERGPNKPLTLEDVITLPAPIEFKFDTDIMLPGAEVYLNQVLAILQKHPEVLKLEVQGHTSSEGGPEYNLRLSDLRSKAVVRWLVEHGIEAKRLIPHGYGLTQPIVPNDTEANRQKNRRVQFRLVEKTPESGPTGLEAPATPAPAAKPPATTAPATVKPAAPAPAPATPAPAAVKPAAPMAAPAAPAPAAVKPAAPAAAPAVPAPATAKPPAAPAAPAPAPVKPAAPAAAPAAPAPTTAKPPAAPALAPTTAKPPAAPAPAAPAPTTAKPPVAAPPTATKP